MVATNGFDLFKGKKILITGDTGFKGSWLVIWLLELGAEVYGYSLPALHKDDNYIRCNLSGKINHLDGDVRDYSAMVEYFKSVQPEIAIHMAAQALVIPSYTDPVTTFETNVMGTVNFFEAVKLTPSIKVAINVTSDKCYDNKESIWGYKEIDPMGGKDPYSASKGCSELITSSYMSSFFQDTATNIASVRAGNVIGGGDWAENRIIPDFYRAIKSKSELIIRNPYSTRPWQFVLEPIRGYLTLIVALFNDYGKNKKFQSGWNFGPSDENNVSVEELIKNIINSNGGHGKFSILSRAEAAQLKKEATLLKLDISKAREFLNWKPALNLQQTVSFIADGYKTDLEIADDESFYQSRLKQVQAYTQLINR
ncbi:MAG: CDP-glucose 4,6-dehydratase [Bacteroidota bacterium]